MLKGVFLTDMKYIAPLVQINVLVVFASLGALAFAFFMQIVRHLDPCHLCILERWPYGATSLMGFAGLILGFKADHMALGRLLLAVTALTFLGEAGLAFYHVGVEQHWWRSMFEGCTIDFTGGQDLLAQIEAKPAARCDEVSWRFLGLSMASWNAVFALIMSGLCALFAIRAPRLPSGRRADPA